MFRNHLYVTYKKPEVYRFNTRPRIKKNCGSVTFVLKKKAAPQIFLNSLHSSVILHEHAQMIDLSIFKFSLEDFGTNFSLYKDLEYIIRKLKISSFRLYNLFFFIPFISKATAQEVRVGRRIFRLFPCWVKKKTKKNYAISLVAENQLRNFIGY